ncbi:MAG: Uma2 family endonuclease [Bryobacteraceae bacterium]
MSAQSQPRLTPEQYLDIERAATDVRSEYYNGRMYAMSGGTHPHAIVIGNLGSELRIALKKGPCVVTTSDLRVRVSKTGLYTYPDIVVVCDPPQYGDGRHDTVLNPTLIIEVLSPSTEAYDRGFKFAQYRALESLQEYALVSQSEPLVEIFRRQPGGDWLLSESAGIDAVCRFDSVGCTVPMKDIYNKVSFGGEAGVADRPSPAV